MNPKPEAFLPISEVKRRSGLGVSTIYRWISDGRFPRPCNIGPRTVRWLESDIDAWMRARIEPQFDSSRATHDPGGNPPGYRAGIRVGFPFLSRRK